MKACKYFLPCGYCDKYDVPCKTTSDGIIDYNVLIGEIDSETAEEMKKYNCCEHEWRYKGQSTNGHHYECIKCGTMKQVPLESLYTTDKECTHEWKLTNFELTKDDLILNYTCQKCNATQKESIGFFIDNFDKRNT